MPLAIVALGVFGVFCLFYQWDASEAFADKRVQHIVLMLIRVIFAAEKAS